MTEYELINLYYVANEQIASYAMNFVSILSGYLLATYFLGNKINSTQYYILTLSYLAVMLATVMASFMRVR